MSHGPWGSGFYYDGNGNITQQKFGAYQLNYGYDNVSQRLQTVSGAKSYNLQYDAYGNISSRGDGVSFTYDAAGSLRYSNKGAASQMAYQYDASGTRVLSAGNGINKLEFTAANGLLLYEINLNNNVATKHLYLGRNKLADIENGNVSYYHSDPIGSPLAATDASGNLLWRTSYRPYGERLTGGDGGKNKEWFGGKPYEDATGLSYFGARWYDPILGRFAAMDPVDWSEANPVHSFNRYGYANNNPYKFVDPDGREPTLSPVTVHADPTYGQNTGRGGCSPCQQRAETNQAMARQVTNFVNGAIDGFGIALQSIKDFIAWAKGDSPVPGAKLDENKKGGKTIQWDKPGDMETADQDFDNLNPTGVKDLDGGEAQYGKGRRGILPDGRNVIVRPGERSMDGYPTLEIQTGKKNRDKVRYGR